MQTIALGDNDVNIGSSVVVNVPVNCGILSGVGEAMQVWGWGGMWELCVLP
jgi:hypothetical protein